jgi:hypothetical protein
MLTPTDISPKIQRGFPPSGERGSLRGWVTLKDVILRRANHFKNFYDLLVRLDEAFSMPLLPLLPKVPDIVANPTSFGSIRTSPVSAQLPAGDALVDIASKVLASILESAKDVGLVRTIDRIGHFKEYIRIQGTNLSFNDPRIEHELRTLREALDDDLDERHVFFPDEKKFKFALAMAERFNFEAIYNNLPDAHFQIIQAEECYLADRDAACIYHAVGAAEYGARALATKLHLSKHLQDTFGSIVKHLRSKIEKLEKIKRTAKRNAELDFYHTLIDQCGFFNEHWRKRLAHLPMPKYNETEALDALTRSAEFLKTLAERGIELPRELPTP